MMSEKSQPLSNAELLATLRAERAHLDNLLADLSDEQMTQANVQDDWAIKDIVAHITAWERLAADRLSAAINGSALNFPIINNWDDVHAFNAARYAENKDKPIAAILEDAQTSYRSFVSIVEGLDDDFIANPLPFDWADNMTAFELIAANSYWHYKEHSEAIENWLRK